jgi:hypothetical protein
MWIETTDGFMNSDHVARIEVKRTAHDEWNIALYPALEIPTTLGACEPSLGITRNGTARTMRTSQWMISWKSFDDRLRR